MMLRVAVVAGFGSVVGVVQDAVLDGDELCGVCLASDADECVTSIVVVAESSDSVTDSAGHRRFSHANIIARRLRPAGSNTQRSSATSEKVPKIASSERGAPALDRSDAPFGADCGWRVALICTRVLCSLH